MRTGAKKCGIKRESNEKRKRKREGGEKGRERERETSCGKRGRRSVWRVRSIVPSGKFCRTIERVDLALVRMYIILAPTIL